MARIRKKTLANVYRLQTSFNRKVKRLEKLNRNIDLLPRKISKKEINKLIEESTTTKDLKRELKRLERFIKRGGEKVINYEGERMLQSDKETLISMRRSAVAKLRNDINLELTKIGNPITYKELMKNPKLSHFFGTEIGNSVEKLRRVRSKSGSSSEQIEKLRKYISDSKKWATFRDNFIGMIEDMGYLYGISNDEVESVTNRVRKLSAFQFARLYRENSWVEQLILGYHIFREFGLDLTYSRASYREDYLMDWESFKASIDVAIKETVNDVNNLSEFSEFDESEFDKNL